MADSHISVFDIGIELRAKVYHNLADADCAFLLMENPKRSKTTFAADIIDEVQGVIRYISKQGDFDVPGDYRIQAHVVFNDGSQKTGSVHTFRVHGLFE